MRVILKQMGDNTGLGLGWLRAVAQGYTYSYNKNELGSIVSNDLKELLRKTWLGLGWLRAVATGYNYSCSEFELISNF